MSTWDVFWISFFDFLTGPELVIAALVIVAVGLGQEIRAWWQRRRRRARGLGDRLQNARVLRHQRKPARASWH